MKTFELTVAGIDYSEYVNYPVVITDTTLDESLSMIEINLLHTPFSSPVKPNRKATLKISDSNTTRTTELILINDSVEKVGVKSLYNHKFQLMEYTYALQIKVLPDMTITRVEGRYEPTMLDVVQKILFVAGLDISISSETAALLDAVNSPEWTFTRMSVLEALRLSMNQAKLIPFMEVENILSHKAILQENAENLDEFITESKAYDPETYKSALYSPASNMVIGDLQETIVEPKAGWSTPRATSGARVTSDNAFIPTSMPIYKVDRLDVRMKVRYRRFTTLDDPSTGTFYTVDVPLEDLGIENFKGLTDFVFEQQVYDLLPNTNTINVNNGEIEAGQAAALSYVQGREGISGLSNAAPARWSWFPNRQSIREILSWIMEQPESAPYASQPFVYTKPMVEPDALSDVLAALDAIWANTHDTSIATNERSLQFFLIDNENPNAPVEDMEFRVEYTPLINTNLFSFRQNRFSGDENEIQSEQFYNQTSTVISSQALGELHRTVLSRGVGEQRQINFMKKNLSDMLPTGIRDGEYVLTNASHVINRNSIVSDYVLNEYEAKLNKYIGVLEAYRQFAVPNENIVERQITRNIFGKFSLVPDSGVVISTFSRNRYLGGPEEEVYVAQFTGHNGLRYVLPAISYAFNNTVSMTAKHQSNNVVGRKVEIDDGNYFEQPVVYTNDWGYVENMRLSFGAAATSGDWDLDDSLSYPQYQDFIPSTVYSSWVPVRKDARELISVTTQVHHLDETGFGHITPLYSKSIGLVGGEGFSNFRTAFFTEKPQNNKIPAAAIVQSTPISFTSEVGIITIAPKTNNFSATRNYWGITDSNNNLLVWFEETVSQNSQTSTIYLNFTSDFGGILPEPQPEDTVRVRVNAPNGALFNSNTTGVINSTSIDEFIALGDDVMITAAPTNFLRWETANGIFVSNSEELEYANLTQTLDLVAVYST